MTDYPYPSYENNALRPHSLPIENWERCIRCGAEREDRPGCLCPDCEEKLPPLESYIGIMPEQWTDDSRTTMSIDRERQIGPYVGYLYGWKDPGCWWRLGLSFSLEYPDHVSMTLMVGPWDLWLGLQRDPHGVTPCTGS